MQPLFGLITQSNLSETGIEAVVWWVQTMATKETTVCVAPMHLIFPYTYLDNRDSRLHNICVTSDKLVFYPSFCNIFFFFENYALFSDKNDNIEYRLSYLNPSCQKNNSCTLCMPLFKIVHKRWLAINSTVIAAAPT